MQAPFRSPGCPPWVLPLEHPVGTAAGSTWAQSGQQGVSSCGTGAGHSSRTSAEPAFLMLLLFLHQIFPLSPGPRWQSSSARPAALALQQALGQELARVRQGSPEVSGVTVRLLQAIATLLNSPHSGALVMSMHRSHFLACPLMRQLCQYQVSVSAAKFWAVGSHAGGPLREFQHLASQALPS